MGISVPICFKLCIFRNHAQGTHPTNSHSLFSHPHKSLHLSTTLYSRPKRGPWHSNSFIFSLLYTLLLPLFLSQDLEASRSHNLGLHRKLKVGSKFSSPKLVSQEHTQGSLRSPSCSTSSNSRFGSLNQSQVTLRAQSNGGLLSHIGYLVMCFLFKNTRGSFIILILL